MIDWSKQENKTFIVNCEALNLYNAELTVIKYSSTTYGKGPGIFFEGRKSYATKWGISGKNLQVTLLIESFGEHWTAVELVEND